MADGGPQDAIGHALPRPKRAFGRSLADFRIEGAATPNGLHPAEERLLGCAARGEKCRIAPLRPEEATPENTVRGAFLRFLLLGGDEDAPVHEKGVILYGAVIEGSMDLQDAQNVRSFGFWCCRVDQPINGRNATFGDITLNSCVLTSLNLALASVSGDICLNDSSLSGETFISGAKIIGMLSCRGSTFHNPGGAALNCKNIIVSGSVFINKGFAASGSVDFSGAEIGRDLYCQGGYFDHFSTQPWKLEISDLTLLHALNLGGVKIGGTLWLYSLKASENKYAAVHGSLNLKDAYTERFRNHPSSWPPAGGPRNFIELDGFVYERLGGGSPTDAETCKRWLLRQPFAHLGEDFRTQPFEQLIKVLRNMGLEADARKIAMFKHSLLQKRKKPWKEPFAWIIGLLWGLSCGYGYRPTRLFVTLVALWLACGFLYQTGAAHGGFAPKDAQVWTNAIYNEACGKNWTECAELKAGGGGKVSEIIAFNPFTYSADMLLPAIDLGQRLAWTPMWREIEVALPGERKVTLPAGTLRAAAWLENVLGVAGVILIGAILSGIVKRD